jgi:hypothetical protein
LTDRKNQLRNSFVRIAQRLGFLSEEQAQRADNLVDDNPDAVATQDLVVRAGLLTEEQAVQVEDARKTEDLDGHLEDQFKRANAAADRSASSARRLVMVTENGNGNSHTS